MLKFLIISEAIFSLLLGVLLGIAVGFVALHFVAKFW